MKVAVCQHPVTGRPLDNFVWVVQQARAAAQQGADIAHFSECNLSGYAGHQFPTFPRPQELEQQLKECLRDTKRLAEELGVWIIIGAHHWPKAGGEACGTEGGKPFNSLFIFDPKGSNGSGSGAGGGVLRYDKRMLTAEDCCHYSAGSMGGSARGEVFFRVKDVRCGVLICHEWRYPELYRSYQFGGAKVLFQSFYDGGLQRDAFSAPVKGSRGEGRELGRLIVGSVLASAAHCGLAVSVANCGNAEGCFGGFVAGGDGALLGTLRRGHGKQRRQPGGGATEGAAGAREGSGRRVQDKEEEGEGGCACWGEQGVKLAVGGQAGASEGGLEDVGVCSEAGLLLAHVKPLSPPSPSAHNLAKLCRAFCKL